MRKRRPPVAVLSAILAGLMVLAALPPGTADALNGALADLTVEQCGDQPGTCQGLIKIGSLENPVTIRVEPGRTTVRKRGQEVLLSGLARGDNVYTDLYPGSDLARLIEVP